MRKFVAEHGDLVADGLLERLRAKQGAGEERSDASQVRAQMESLAEEVSVLEESFGSLQHDKGILEKELEATRLELS